MAGESFCEAGGGSEDAVLYMFLKFLSSPMPGIFGKIVCSYLLVKRM